VSGCGCEAAWQRADGTAQEYVVLPERQAVALPDNAALELGASLGIPALTAHRCLTVSEGSGGRLSPGSLAGRVVLVAGGAGAVGNASIQLARWAGAKVVATVSGPEKADLARAAGADVVVNYRTEDTAAAIARAAPDGVDTIVEVAPSTNAASNHSLVRSGATIAVYATDGPGELSVSVFPLMAKNVRYQFVLVYTVPAAAKSHAVTDVSAALAAAHRSVAGRPSVHHYPLDQTAAARAVEAE
jgi:NADPH2:quinone reductase